jgi:predicted  nucleic acid-binding Zn-ribbon protein
MQKQPNEFREDFDKLQSETKETIKNIGNKENNTICERGNLTKMKNLRRENKTETLEIIISLNQIKDTVGGHSSRLEQVEDRISGLEGKIDIKEKDRRNFSQTTQEL